MLVKRKLTKYSALSEEFKDDVVRAYEKNLSIGFISNGKRVAPSIVRRIIDERKIKRREIGFNYRGEKGRIVAKKWTNT